MTGFDGSGRRNSGLNRVAKKSLEAKFKQNTGECRK